MRSNVLAVSQGLSAGGDAMAVIALMLLLQGQGASSVLVSALVMINLLPSVVLGPLFAPMLDRIETARLLIITLSARALLGVAIAFAPSTEVMLCFVAVAAVVSAVDGPAMTMLVPTALPAGVAPTVGYARSDTCRGIGALLGPAVAGVMVGAVGTRLTLLVDAGTFAVLVGVIAASGLRRPPQFEAVRRPNWFQQVAAGPHALFRDRTVAAAVIALAAAILFTSSITVAQVFFVRQDLNEPATVYGFIVTVRAFGRLVASSLVVPRIATRHQPVALWAAGILMGVSLTIVGLWQELPVAFVGLFLVGVSNSVQSLAIRGIVQERTAAGSQGRAFAAMMAVNNGSTMIGTAAGGPLVAVLGGAGALVLGGAGTLLATSTFGKQLLRQRRLTQV